MNTTIKLLKRFLIFAITSEKEPEYLWYINNEITGDITTELYYGSSAAVIMPSSIEGGSVTTIGATTFCDNDNITSITIPNTVTTIE